MTKVLCIGGSLTNGRVTSCNGVVHYPYTKSLAKLLGTRAVVHEYGVGGETVHQMTMNLRFEFILNQSESGEPFDAIVLEGGTSDLGYGASPKHVLQHLKMMWQMALEHSRRVHVFVLTIPSVTYASALHNEHRDQVNKMLRKEIAASSNERLCLVDTQQAVSVPSPPRCTSSLWSDNLHYSAQGHEKLAMYIFRTIESRLAHRIEDAETLTFVALEIVSAPLQQQVGRAIAYNGGYVPHVTPMYKVSAYSATSATAHATKDLWTGLCFKKTPENSKIYPPAMSWCEFEKSYCVV